MNSMWQETDQGLHRKFQFSDFKEAFAFMTQVAAIAEKRQHHPTWTNAYNTVEIWLLSHDAGDIVTVTDREMAAEVDELVA